jgi:hypothetical protein
MREHAQPAEGDLAKVAFDLGEGQWHGDLTEMVWAVPLGEHRHRLANVPLFALEVSFRDVLVASPQDGQLMVRGVLARGGHSTYRINLGEMDSGPSYRR